MAYFAQVLLSGIMLGMLYGLVTLGFVLIYKSSGIFNFAQSTLVMIGAFLGYAFIIQLGMPIWAGLLVVLIVSVGLGFALERWPLRPMMGAPAFAKWGIDFVGPIHLAAAMHTHAEYIIIAIDYATKWVEAKATIKNDARTTAKFLYEHVFTRYGLPIEIVSGRGTHFLNGVIEHLLEEFMVIHKKSAPYHPQANG